jgi:Zn-dependent protease
MTGQDLLFLFAFIISVMVHEVTHGYVALYFGDPTAKEAHRLSFNPLRHIDPVGSLVLPFLLIMSGLTPIGWAKAVPVNSQRLRNPKNQFPIVEICGPLSNAVMSAVAYVLTELSIHNVFLPGAVNLWIDFGLVNIVLGIFNLLPIPPFDGSALLERFWPDSKRAAYFKFRSYALPITMGLILVDNQTTHIISGLLANVQSWWFSQLF